MNHLVVMAGGMGSRLWPLSTIQSPKQFVDVLGIGKSLLQLTVERFKDLIPDSNIWIVTSKDYSVLVGEQLPFMDVNHILLEPCMRNTASCIAYASYKINCCDPEANIIITPADHIILDYQNFQRCLIKALHFLEKESSIITLGIKPSRVDTGYGYIKGSQGGEHIQKVSAFHEKPEYEIAKQYFLDGSFYWNAGIFIGRLKTFLSAFQKFTPQISNLFEQISTTFFSEHEQKVVDEKYQELPNISFDYGVLEKSNNIFVEPASFDWSDLGTWQSLFTQLSDEHSKNVVVGQNVQLYDCAKCIIHTHSVPKVIIQGLQDYVVAETEQGLLICQKEKEQQIKKWLLK